MESNTPPLKLTPKQKQVVSLMRDGLPAEDCATNNESSYLLNSKGKKIKISFVVFKNLIQMGLLTRRKVNFAMYKYELTELGKTIIL